MREYVGPTRQARPHKLTAVSNRGRLSAPGDLGKPGSLSGPGGLQANGGPGNPEAALFIAGIFVPRVVERFTEDVLRVRRQVIGNGGRKFVVG